MRISRVTVIEHNTLHFSLTEIQLFLGPAGWSALLKYTSDAITEKRSWAKNVNISSKSNSAYGGITTRCTRGHGKSRSRHGPSPDLATERAEILTTDVSKHSRPWPSAHARACAVSTTRLPVRSVLFPTNTPTQEKQPKHCI